MEGMSMSRSSSLVFPTMASTVPATNAAGGNPDDGGMTARMIQIQAIPIVKNHHLPRRKNQSATIQKRNKQLMMTAHLTVQVQMKKRKNIEVLLIH